MGAELQPKQLTGSYLTMAGKIDCIACPKRPKKPRIDKR
jgi:hypothetical protein